MLTKALLTGGILSVLAGSIVYFGTEGATADERVNDARVELDSTELAGGETTLDEIETEVETKVDAEDPPKTKWLDQYLKSDKSEDKPEATVEETMEKPEDKADAEPKEVPMSEKKPDDKKPGQRTREDILRIMKDASKNPVTDPDIIEAGRNDGPGSGFLPTDEIDEKREFKRGKPELQELPFTAKDYERVLEEARLIEIDDIRDQAMLEIIDHALDRGRTGQAADIVPELSKPELRDTARSRIGVSLAKLGNTEAAFAVLREIEIEELAGPIRLDIIATLMATREERANAKPRLTE